MTDIKLTSTGNQNVRVVSNLKNVQISRLRPTSGAGKIVYYGVGEPPIDTPQDAYWLDTVTGILYEWSEV